MSTDSFIPKIFKDFKKAVLGGNKSSRTQFVKSKELFNVGPKVAVFQDLSKIESFVPQKSNSLFKEQLERRPICKKCLEEKGFDIDCIRNLNPINIDCSGKKVNICSECQEECLEFCDPSFGNTEGQFKNVTEVLATPFYTDYIGNAIGSTFQNQNYWKGYINPNQKEALNILFKGLTGAKVSDIEIEALNAGDSPSISVNYKASVGDYTDDLTAANPEFRMLIGGGPDSGGGNGPGEGGGGGGGGRASCKLCYFNGGAPGSSPLFLVYRYSKCSLVWYPPEYLFNYNTTVTQGQGWKHNNDIAACDLIIADSQTQGEYGGGSSTSFGRDIDLSCTKSYYNNLCSQATNCICRDRTNFPCQCISYPHLSGGMVDTVKKQFNVSQKAYTGGYFPSSDPFAPKMFISEANCMTCYKSYSSEPQSSGAGCDPKFEINRLQNAAWPMASGLGRSPQTIGPYCNSTQQPDTPFYNPGYNVSCFNRGVSPYLNRISRRYYPAAYDIINYGSASPSEYEVLGPTYRNTLIQGGKSQSGNYEWTSVKFKKTYNKKNLLYHKLVGLVGIDHHFECWAYHSKSLFCPPPTPIFNHSRVLILPYERPYAGTVKHTSFTYDPRESLRFQILRSFPRSVIYGSSTVPIFYSDLYAMEVLSQKKGITANGEYFNGEDFLERFYKYFYNMTMRTGETRYGEPLVLNSDVSEFNYVSEWLKLMIKHNVISVKDHAKDISDELKDVLDTATVETNEEGIVTDVIFADELDSVMIGGKVGYVELINFLYTLCEVPSGPKTWENIKPYINSKKIKKLINPQSNQVAPGQMFWAPRRAKLYPTPLKAGLTAWGCENGGCQECNVSPNLVPPDNYPVEFFELYGGDRTWFATTNSGKLQAFGNDTDIFCNTDTQSAINGQAKLGCYPVHLSVLDEINSIQDPTATMSDGQVIKVSSKGNVATALVEYGNGIVLGLYQDTNNRAKANSGYVKANGDLAYEPFYGRFLIGDGTTPSVIRSWGGPETHGVFYDNEFYTYYVPSWLPYSGTSQTVAGRIQNNSFIFKDVASGVKHTAAITFDGALFMTPDSSNLNGSNELGPQTSYGYPTVSGGKTTNRLNVGTDPLIYYKHFPKPGYFSDEEWNALLNTSTAGSGEYFKPKSCTRSVNEPKAPCDIRCYLFQIGNQTLAPEQSGFTGYLFAGSTGGTLRVDTPVYTNVAAGHYHTLALSDDNNIKIWGQYVKIKPDGSSLGASETDVTGNTGVDPISVFLPAEISNYSDKWYLGGFTSGCGSNSGNVATVATEAYKTVYQSRKIFAIDGGPDYSIAARQDSSAGNMLVVWGHSEMVDSVRSAAFNTQFPFTNGLTAYLEVPYHRIEKIVAGPNAISVIHRKPNNFRTYTDIFVRKGKVTGQPYPFGLTAGLDGRFYSDVTLTYGNAAGIYTAGYVANTWNSSSFSDTHRRFQFNNYGTLPQYFRSQAFFRAVPGRWEITKWLFGRPCHLLGTDYLENHAAKPDPCSIYYRKNDINRSYTGVPHYYWMRGSWKRNQLATPLHSYDPSQGKGCGIIRNLQNEDNLPTSDFGINPDTNSLLYAANNALNRGFGGCYANGDICWIGDGSPSAYAYMPTNFSTNAKVCQCLDDVCGCPPFSRSTIEFDCEQDGYVGTNCFGYVTGRVGFNSNKDYFIQSAKSFGRLSGIANSTLGSGECCGVVKTNITGFLYAKRDYYYAYNSSTENYEVKTAPLAYRPVYLGSQRAQENETYGITSTEFYNEIMVPKDALVESYTVQNVMLYPKVFVGGPNLTALETSYNESKKRNFFCPASSICSTGICDPPSTCSVSGCWTKSPYDIVGPGGWVYSPNRISCDNTQYDLPSLDGQFNETANLYDKTMYLSIVATDDWLKGAVVTSPYSGNLPPGLCAPNCWCGPTSPANPTGIGTCPGGRCPNGERQCNNCVFCCALIPGLFYEIAGQTGIDNPDLYYPANRPIQGPSEAETAFLTDSGIPSSPSSQSSDYYWYRVYENIPSTYKLEGCNSPYGFTGDPIGFQGNGSFGAFDFRAYCAGANTVIGEVGDIRCDLFSS